MPVDATWAAAREGDGHCRHPGSTNSDLFDIASAQGECRERRSVGAKTLVIQTGAWKYNAHVVRQLVLFVELNRGVTVLNT